MENFGEILMSASFLLVVVAVFISIKKAEAAEKRLLDITE